MPQRGVPFETVLAQELAAIRQRRELVHGKNNNLHSASGGDAGLTPLQEARRAALADDLVGLAFSGGGIRSGTFNLGILQALASLGLLTRFDYLSTVSGGGYIAGWLAAWVRRENVPEAAPLPEGQTALHNVERQLSPNRIGQAKATRPLKLPGAGLLDETPDLASANAPACIREEEPEPVRHLRAFSRYLAPKAGLLSADFWTLLSIYLRNLLINALVLVPVLLAVVLGGRFLLWSFTVTCPEEVGRWVVFFFWVALMGVPFACFSRQRRLFRGSTQGQQGAHHLHEHRGPEWSWRKVFWFIVIPLLLAAVVGTWSFGVDPTSVPQRAAGAEGGERRPEQDESHSRLPGKLRPKVGSAEREAREDFHERYRRPIGWAVAGCVLALLGLLGWALFRAGFRPSFWASCVAVVLGLLLLTVVVFVYPTLPGVVGLPSAERPVAWARGLFASLFARAVRARRTIAFVALLLYVLCFLGALLWCLARAGFERVARQTALVLLLLAALAFAGSYALHVGWGHGLPTWPRMTLSFFLLSLFLTLPISPLVYGLGSRTLRLVLAGACMGLVLGLGFGVTLYKVLLDFSTPASAEWFPYAPYFNVTFGPPLFLLTFLIAAYAEAALAGRDLTEYEREWRSRLGALLLRTAAAWLVFFVVTLYLPFALDQLKGRYSHYTALINWGLVLSWLLSTLGGALAGRSPRAAEGGPSGGQVVALLIALAPPLFLIGLLTLLSLAVSALPGLDNPSPPTDFLERAQAPQWAAGAGWLAACAAAGFLVSILVNVNLFSLHALYANRLTRCYLGASRCKQPPTPGAPANLGGERRRANAFTGFDPDDDMPLACLRIDPRSIRSEEHRERFPHPYLGPYPLFNTSLNLVAADELALQDRKGESFVLTPDFCGSQITGYATTPDARDTIGNLSLGRVIALSGAAADPNMSFHQSPSLTALMTALNLRLGRWVENPRSPEDEGWFADLGHRDSNVIAWLRGEDARGDEWGAYSPRFGGLLWDELIGNTNEHGRYVHLTDGGHFENLGVYELVRRRCRFIVVCDAAEDALDASENLANMMRLVRTDFGISIEIDTSPIRKEGPDGLSRWHVAIGAIRYDEVDPNAVAGTLVFIRSSLTGDEPADLRNYAATHPDFPHRSTGDQFFTEEQFESYRALGHHVGRAVFADAVEQMSGRRLREQTRSLFANLRRRWFPPPPNLDERYTAAAIQINQFLEGQRDNEHLRWLSLETYPELAYLSGQGWLVPQWPPAGADLEGPPPAPMPEKRDAIAELHALEQALQTMELAWLGIRLDGYHAHPMNRGWMNLFRRWSTSPAFYRFWPILRGRHSKDFVRFCERALNLSELPVKAVRLDRVRAALKGDRFFRAVCQPLNQELFREWAGVLPDFARPLEVRPQEYLLEVMRRAEHFAAGRGARSPIWVLATGQAGSEPGLDPAWEPGDFPQGIALAYPKDEPKRPKGSELFFWVRGAYRTLGLGRGTLGPILDQLDEEFGPAWDHVVTRFPGVGSGASDRLQRTLWTAFFHDYDFLRRTPVRVGQVVDEVLERRLPSR